MEKITLIQNEFFQSDFWLIGWIEPKKRLFCRTLWRAHKITHSYLIHTKEKPAISWTLGRRLELRVFSFFYERRHARRNCWFSHDVTKIQITKLSIRLRFYFNDVFDRAAENIQIWWKHFSRYLVNEIYLWPKSWRGSLHIYLLLFSRVWTLSNWTVLFIYLL